MTTSDPPEEIARSAELRARLATFSNPSEMLEEIFAVAPVALQIYARDGRCVLVNPRHTELFGAVPPPDYNVFEDTVLIERGVTSLLRRAFEGERITIPPLWYDVRELTNVTIASGGRRFAVSAQLVPLRDARGAVEHVLFVFHDVTATEDAREQAEAAAREAQRARTLAENSANHSSFLAEAGRLLSATLQYEVTLARVARLATPVLADFCVVDVLQEDGSLRRVAAAHADPHAQPLLDELCAKFPPQLGSPQPAMVALTTHKPVLMEEVDPAVVAAHTVSPEHAELMLRLGVRSHLAVPMSIADRALGTISLGYVGTRRYHGNDVPLVEALAGRAALAIENARLYGHAQAARAEAEAANRAKDQFLAMLGHELRNPLAPIVTALELMRRREGPSRERSIIERQVVHLRRLVDDLLDVARIARGRLELDRRPVEFAEAVHDAIELARPLITGRGHGLTVRCAPSGLVVFGDRVRLAQVVANLLTNSARYSPDGSQIVLDVERRGEEIALRVRDDGLGIAPELLSRVFDLFAQGQQAVDRAGGGLGLGLAIVRSLVDLHGGRVRAHSDGLGHGSEFEVVLPSPSGMSVGRSTHPALTPVELAASHALVLIVDDNEDAAELLGQALARQGYRTLIAHEGATAVALAREQSPDVALLDIGLPGMDGHELARRLRELPGLADVRLIALTGYGQATDRARSSAAGFARHFVKPVDVATLQRAIEELLQVQAAADVLETVEQ